MAQFILISILVISGIASIRSSSPFNYDFSKLGEACTADKDCAAISDSACVSNKCACKDGYIGAATNDKCTARTLGESCTDDKDCFRVNNTTCADNKCKCVKGFIAQPDKLECVEGVLNSTCTTSDECFLIGYAECNKQHHCACKAGYEVTIDEKCGSDSSHCLDELDCKNNLTHWCNESGLCSCRVGYEVHGDDCVAPFNKPCTPEEGCIDQDAECVNFRCNCRSELVEEGGRCVGHHGTHIHLRAQGNGEIIVDLDIDEN